MVNVKVKNENSNRHSGVSLFCRPSEATAEESSVQAPSRVDPSGPKPTQDRRRESGRSLTEMLGTLAIMGVLTIGAIAGFNYAMNKHRSNEILDEARKRAYTVMTQIQLGLKKSLSEYDRHNAFAGGTFGSNIVTEGLKGQFALKITDVKKAVCQNLVDSVGVSTPLRRISVLGNPSVEIESCTDSGEYLLVYNNDLTNDDKDQSIACHTDSDCGECGTCNTNGGICHYPEQDSKRCSGTTPYCNKGRCQECEPGKFQNSNGECRSCDDAYVGYKASSLKCSACPNRVIEGGQYCINCETSGNIWSAMSIAESTLNSCKQKGYIGYFYKGALGYSYRNCSHAGEVSNSTVEYCAMCDDSDTPRELVDGYCQPKKCDGNRFRSTNGGCFNCDDYNITNTSEKECHKCSNTIFTQSSGGTCYSCPTSLDGNGSSFDVDSKECYRCQTMFMGTDRCYECGYFSAVAVANDTDCNWCPNRFMGTDGKCYSCKYNKSVVADSTECSRCPNRVYSNGKCVLDCRTESEPFIDTSDGKCYSCSSTVKSFPADEDGCSTCSNRVYINGKCVLDCRTTEEPLMSSSGSCYPCDTDTSVTTSEAICDACPTRTYNEWERCYKEQTCTTTDSIRKKTGACAICSATGNLTQTPQSECAKCKDLGTPRWSNATGATCYRCDNKTSAVASTPAYCGMCDGTDYPRFLGTDEKCYSCDSTASVEVENEAACIGKCGTKRTYDSATKMCNKAS